MSKQEIADEKTAKWLKEKTVVVMSNELWLALTIYIDRGKLARQAELEQWEVFDKEKNQDGTPRYLNSKEHLEFLKDQEEKLGHVMHHIALREVYAERSIDEEEIC